MKNLVEKLRYTPSKGISVWGDLQARADAIEALTAERDTLRQQLAEAQGLIEASRKQEPVSYIYGLVGDEDYSSTPVYAAPVIADTVQLDAERYRFLRDHFATKSENSVDDFIALEPMTGEYFDAHIDILMSEFYAAMKGAA